MEIGIFVLEEEDFFALLLFPFAMFMKQQGKWDDIIDNVGKQTPATVWYDTVRHTTTDDWHL